MRILQTTNSVSRRAGGPFESIRRLSQELVDLRQDVRCVGMLDSFTEADRPQWGRVPVATFEPRGLHAFGYAPGMLDHLMRTDADIVHAHGIWQYSTLAAKNWGATTKRPFVLSLRGMLEPWARNHHRWRKDLFWQVIEKRTVSAAAALHATSRREADNLRKLGLTNPIAVIPNGVDVPISAERLPGSSSEHILLALSRLHPVKGLMNLVRAIAVIRPKGWKVVIAGPDENGHEADLRKAVVQQKVEEYFDFVGPVYNEAKRDLFYQADLFVLPSYSENFGMAIAEALAAGLPVITTRATPWQEIENRKCGWWIDVGVDPLAGALREAAGLSNTERQEMGRRGRSLVQERYSWRTIGQQMLSLYTWVVQNGQVPSCVMLAS